MLNFPLYYSLSFYPVLTYSMELCCCRQQQSSLKHINTIMHFGHNNYLNSVELTLPYYDPSIMAMGSFFTKSSGTTLLKII